MTQQCKKKNRIGYVLKSANVRTQGHAHPHTYLNHMKLHVNRPNTKKARSKQERKRKEQESAEAFQRTKKENFLKSSMFLCKQMKPADSRNNIQMVDF